MTKPVLAYLGLIGDPMTKRLLAAGYQVHVWNRSSPKLAPALDLGRDTGTPLPVSGLAAQLLRTLAAQGKGEEELSAVIDLYGKQT